MTVETKDNRIVYPADGVKVDFDFNFKTDDDGTIFVYEDAILSTSTIVVTLNTDQELTPGGSVNITPAIAAPTIVTIQREEDFLQLTKYPVGGDFPSFSHEKALDKVAKLTQQIDDKFVRSIRADINEPLAGVSLVIPNATDRQNTFLGFDGLGNAIVSPGGPGTVPISLFMTPVVSSANAEVARLFLETMAGFKYIPVAGTDTYTSVNIPAHTSYVTDVVYFGDFVNPNTTTSSTWEIDGLGQRNIVSKNGSLLGKGDLDGSHFLLYDGAEFRLLNPSKRDNSSFSAVAGTAQTNVTGPTKVQFDTKAFDTNGDYDEAVNYRFTPTIPGKYQLNATVHFVLLSAGNFIDISIFKNGAVIKRKIAMVPTAGSEHSLDISDIVSADGVADYYEIFVENFTINTSSIEINGNGTFFSGAKVDD